MLEQQLDEHAKELEKTRSMSNEFNCNKSELDKGKRGL